MALIKTKEDIEYLKEGGRRLGDILKKVAEAVEPGMKTSELDNLARELIRAGGDEPSFLNYRPSGAPRKYPASLCVSVNNKIVHGIPTDNEVLKEGDIVGLDLGLKHKGLFVDTAVTVAVGTISDQDRKLMDVTRESLTAGIKAAKVGATIGDIGQAIEAVAKPHNYGVIRELGGHGVGHKVHEEPYIPNFGKSGVGLKLKPGMVLALEPMFNQGSRDIILDDDDFTFRTADNQKSAHFEHTILITENGPEILTKA